MRDADKMMKIILGHVVGNLIIHFDRFIISDSATLYRHKNNYVQFFIIHHELIKSDPSLILYCLYHHGPCIMPREHNDTRFGWIFNPTYTSLHISLMLDNNSVARLHVCELDLVSR